MKSIFPRGGIRMKKKILILTVVIILIVVIVILNLINKDAGKAVEVALVGKSNITSRVSATGELQAKSQVNISAETIGRVRKIYFQEGDLVKKDNLLIELDDTQANANRQSAEAQLKQAEQEFTRGQQLFEKALISKESFEKIALSYATAKAQYEQVLDAYEKTKIYAPISGRIMKLDIKEGETAVMGTLNNLGTALMTIADLSRMLAVIQIDETDVPQVKVGQSTQVIADALPDSTYPGQVTKVSLMPVTNQLTTENVTDFEVEVELSKFSPLLRPGMNVKADIITSEKSDVLAVPIQALSRRMVNNKMNETVFIVKNKKAKLQEVQTGSSSDTDIEITSGLVQDDTVITGPYRILSTLKDNEPVKFEALQSDTSKKNKPQGNSARRFFRIIR